MRLSLVLTFCKLLLFYSLIKSKWNSRNWRLLGQYSTTKFKTCLTLIQRKYRCFWRKMMSVLLLLLVSIVCWRKKISDTKTSRLKITRRLSWFLNNSSFSFIIIQEKKTRKIRASCSETWPYDWGHHLSGLMPQYPSSDSNSS